jgi:hypothetical protein
MFTQDIWSHDIQLTENTTPQGRWYVLPTGERYASVTTMLGKTADEDKAQGLREWRERVGEAEANAITSRAAGEGTRLHKALEHIITNQWTPFHQSQVLPNIKALLNQMVPVLRSHVTAVHGSEVPLYSRELQVAGRTDCICSWDGVYTILDFKRSNKPKQESYIEDYFHQATTYALMAEERFGITIPSITILIGVSNGEGPQFWHFSKNKYSVDVKNRIRLFHSQVDMNVGEPSLH